MAKVRASVVRWVSDDFPGWVELSVRDASGRRHRIVEKVPVVTSMPLAATSTFPVEVWIDAEVTDVGDPGVRVTLSHHIETLDGVRQLEVSSDDVDSRRH